MEWLMTIYSTACEKCLNQYVGQTTDVSRFWWNNFKDNNRKFQLSETCIQERYFRHFSSIGYAEVFEWYF